MNKSYNDDAKLKRQEQGSSVLFVNNLKYYFD